MVERGEIQHVFFLLPSRLVTFYILHIIYFIMCRLYLYNIYVSVCVCVYVCKSLSRMECVFRAGVCVLLFV